jgi:hypothetical protein
VLYDENGRPLGAKQASLPREAGPFEVDLGPCDPLDEARVWTLTLLTSDRAIPVRRKDAAGTPRDVPAFPARFDEPVVVQVASVEESKMRVRSVGLRRDGEGGIVAEVETVGLDHWKEHAASATVVLTDEADVPIASGTSDRTIHVEGEVVQDRASVPLGRSSRKPRRMLVGLRTVLTGMPMGSRWGMLMSADRSHPIGLLLDGDDPQVWRRGLAALNDEARASFRRIPYDPDGSKARQARGEARRAIRPYRDHLPKRFQTADEPAALPLLCRLAGYSQDERLAEPLRRLLDHTRADVRDSAAIGLGLFGDASVMPRLRAIREALPRDGEDGSRLAADIRVDVANALGALDDR